MQMDMSEQRLVNGGTSSPGTLARALFGLERLIVAQNARQNRSKTTQNVYAIAYEKIAAGEKHDQWYIDSRLAEVLGLLDPLRSHIS